MKKSTNTVCSQKMLIPAPKVKPPVQQQQNLKLQSKVLYKRPQAIATQLESAEANRKNFKNAKHNNFRKSNILKAIGDNSDSSFLQTAKATNLLEAEYKFVSKNFHAQLMSLMQLAKLNLRVENNIFRQKFLSSSEKRLQLFSDLLFKLSQDKKAVLDYCDKLNDWLSEDQLNFKHVINEDTAYHKYEQTKVMEACNTTSPACHLSSLNDEINLASPSFSENDMNQWLQLKANNSVQHLFQRYFTMMGYLEKAYDRIVLQTLDELYMFKKKNYAVQNDIAKLQNVVKLKREAKMTQFPIDFKCQPD